ncbi:T9SS type A sorting domain-containing protein, partial [candidate division WOR-3 bacterium]|nr:T9SS type A sorting domain-containing protein [candidate division WOR-3 bacterium]
VSWPLGWVEVQSVPSGAKAVKDGGWLTIEGDGGLIYAARGTKTPDFFSYDATADSDGVWTALAAWPNGTEGKAPYKGAVGVHDGSGFIYATKGNGTLGFWRYSADSMAWRQMPDVPLGVSMKKVKGGTDMVYVQEGDTGYVYLLKGYKQDFFRFNTVSGVWDTNLPVAPAGSRPKWDKGSWMAYDGMNTFYAHKAKYHELWPFDVTTHTWASSALPGMPLVGMIGKSKKSKDGGCGAYYEGALYALKGGNTQEWWKYQIDSASWRELDTIPSFGSTAKKKRVKAGGDVVSYGGGYFFALKGNKTLEFWRYGEAPPAFGSWQPTRGGAAAEPVAGRTGLAVVPNPLTNGWAAVRYALPAAGPVRISVYDVTGRSVAALSLVAGRSGSAQLDLRHLSAGVYLVKLQSQGMTAAQKLIVQ